MRGGGGRRTRPPIPRASPGQREDGSLLPVDQLAEWRFPPGMFWGGNVWKRCWGTFQVWFSDRTVTVVKLRRTGLPPEWTDVAHPVFLTAPDVSWSEAMASKWIKAAVGRKVKARAGQLPGDPQLCDGRPALTDFLCEVEGPSGGVREPSVLMVCMTAEGVRCGLKDDDAGGWCWRVGKTFQDALDSIEKALTADEPAFRQGRQQSARKRR